MQQREQIEARIHAVCDDREHGSRWLVREAVLILRDVASMAWSSPAEHMHYIIQYVRQIAQARPAMAALTSGVCRVASVDGGPAAVVEEAERVLAEYDTAIEQIAAHAQPYLNGQIMTCSISGTVLEVLLAHRQQIEGVVVLEGRPRYEGRDMARELGRQGLAVTLITDAQADIFLPRCQSVVVGADSILVNGDVLNKAGTALLAWAAHGHNIPLYILCETLKISPRRWIEHDPAYRAQNLALLEEKEPEEVLQEPIPGVVVHNFYFDHTLHRHVTHIITEQGVLDRRAIREIAVKVRASERLVLGKRR
jgi:translation initiation factor 2B subunit (eIF-2B alpha/beta/delta family)